MDEVCVESWSDFMSLSAELDGWAFRGQQDGRWPLLTSLSRYLNAYPGPCQLAPARRARHPRVPAQGAQLPG